MIAGLSAKHRVREPRLTRGARAALCGYSWPGNVRELRNVVEQLCLLRSGKVVRSSDLPASISVAAAGAVSQPSPASIEVRLDQPLDESINRIIEAAVGREGGNRSRAAQRLGIGLRTVQRRLQGTRRGTVPSARLT